LVDGDVLVAVDLPQVVFLVGARGVGQVGADADEVDECSPLFARVGPVGTGQRLEKARPRTKPRASGGFRGQAARVGGGPGGRTSSDQTVLPADPYGLSPTSHPAPEV
jgi:hypothetical protein